MWSNADQRGMQISYSYLKQLNRVDVHGWAPADNDKRGKISNLFHAECYCTLCFIAERVRKDWINSTSIELVVLVHSKATCS